MILAVRAVHHFNAARQVPDFGNYVWYDYRMVGRKASLIVDTRNALAVLGLDEKVWKA